MKNKILLGSVTLLSALMIAACGTKDQKAAETTAAPTTEAVTEATTTANSSDSAKVSLENTERVGREDTGYVNVPKGWINFKDVNGGPQFQYAAPDAYNIVTLNGYTKDQAQPGEGETFGAKMVANRLYSSYQASSDVDKIQGAKRTVSGMEAYLLQIRFKKGKYFFVWVFEKNNKVYSAGFEGNRETLEKMIDLIEQTWGLDPNTPGQ